MNVYFACSITGGRQFEPVYRAIAAALAADGHVVPTAHLADPSVKEMEAVVSPVEVYERDVAWIEACDALVAEVSTPSHGVGYEVAYALGLGKPVLCVYKEKQPVSKMITGNTRANLRLAAYGGQEDAIGHIRSFLATVETDL